MTHDAEIKQTWKEYCDKLLADEEDYTFNENIEMDEENTTGEPTMEEVIRKSKNGKALGNDNVNAELIKYGGEELHTNMYGLIKDVWNKEEMPKEWEEGKNSKDTQEGRLCRLQKL